jgi:dolichol kinase
MVILLGIASVLMIALDIARIYWNPIKNFYLKILGKVLREHEINNRKSLFTGGTYLVISTFFIVLIFPMPVAVCSILIICYSDSAAAIIGKPFGRIKIFNKTLEGSIAFFIVGLTIIFLTPKVSADSFEMQIAVFSLIICTVFEIIPVKIDDNIYLPFIFSFTYYILLKFFNLY